MIQTFKLREFAWVLRVTHGIIEIAETLEEAAREIDSLRAKVRSLESHITKYGITPPEKPPY